MSDPTAWMSQAKCAGADTGLFFPTGNDVARQAKWMCRSCPVQQACGQWAIDNGIEFGIWGGMSTPERNGVKKGVVTGRRPSPITVLLHDPSRHDPDAHGLSRYRRGCRCDVCKAGHAEWHRIYQRQRRAQKRLSA